MVIVAVGPLICVQRPDPVTGAVALSVSKVALLTDLFGPASERGAV